MNRRQFGQTALLAGGAALFGKALSRVGAAPGVLAQSLPSLPSPELSGIEHIVTVSMENRSFDHFFGWLPNADRQQAGLTYVDSNGVAHPTHSLSGDNTGCPAPDPDHSYAGARVEYNGGAMDGFLRAGSNDSTASATTVRTIFRSTRHWLGTTPHATATSQRSLGHLPQSHVSLCRSDGSADRQRRSQHTANESLTVWPTPM